MTYNITLVNVSERTLRAIYSELLGEYEGAEQAFEEASISAAAAEARFDNIKATLRTIKEVLLPPVQEATVLSSDGSRLYLVKRFRDRAPGEQDTCSCPSFQFGRGLDALGQCKHIRTAIQRGQLL